MPLASTFVIHFSRIISRSTLFYSDIQFCVFIRNLCRKYIYRTINIYILPCIDRNNPITKKYGILWLEALLGHTLAPVLLQLHFSRNKISSKVFAHSSYDGRKPYCFLFYILLITISTTVLLQKQPQLHPKLPLTSCDSGMQELPLQSSLLLPMPFR